MSFDMKDYVEVADRIRAWYAEHPDGRIETTIHTLTDSLVIVRAEAYRDAVTPAAGVGHSSLAIPGKTPYTKDSELENAETSAVGRALVMAGIPAKNVASSHEIKSKRSARSTVSPSPARREDWGASPPAPQSSHPSSGSTGTETESGSTPAPAGSTKAAPTGGVGEGTDGGAADVLDTSQDVADLLVAAVAKAGTLANVVVRAHKLDPTVRTEADLLGWHLVEITEGKG